MKTLFVCLMLLVAGLASSAAQPKNWFVRPAQAGNGSGNSWNNAWSLSGIAWASVSAGDTIWMAGGTYGPTLTFGKAGTAGNPITIKRASVADSAATGTAGWNPTFDSACIIPGFSMGGYGNVTLDGNNLANGFQISIGIGGSGGYFGDRGSGAVNNPQSNVRIQWMTIYGPLASGTPGCSGQANCSYGIWMSYPQNSAIVNPYIGHVIINGCAEGIDIQNVSGGVIEYCSIMNLVSLGQHPDILYIWSLAGTPGLTFRYNYVYNCISEGIYENGCCSYNGFYIYGNTFVMGPSGSGYAIEVGLGDHHLYNNNFLGWTGTGNAALYLNQVPASSEVFNNIFLNSNMGGTSSAQVANNLTTTTDPFVASASQNYHLKAGSAPINAGRSISSSDTYVSKDPDGNTRGADGVWDIGAYEYVSGGGGGGTYYASTTGNSGNNGLSPTTAWPLDYAGTHAPSGSTVIVMPGYYSVQLDVETNATFKAQTKWTAIITNQPIAGILIGYSATGLTGAVLDGFRVGYSAKNGVLVYASTNTLKNLWIHDSGTGHVAQNGSGIFMPNVITNITIDSCLLEYNGFSGDQPFDHGAYLNGWYHVVRNNVSRYNWGTGFSPPNQGTCYFYNNFTYHNASYGFGTGPLSSTAKHVFVGNTIIETGYAFYASGTGQYLITNNIIESGANIINGTDVLAGDYNLVSSGAHGGANGKVNANAGFVNSANGLYWLASGSPARNMAQSTARASVDFFGNAQSSVTDVGAVQYSGSLAADTRVLDPSPVAGADYWAILGPGTGPSISIQPTNTGAIVGTTLMDYVAASGSSPLAYQWYAQTNGQAGCAISGQTSPLLSVPNVTFALNTNLCCVITNIAGAITSSVVTASVTNNPIWYPQITQQPQNKTVTVGQNAAFSVVANGITNQYQWMLASVPIAGAIGASYTNVNCQVTDNGRAYSVWVSNSFAVVTSSVATLTVTANPIIQISTNTLNFGIVATNTSQSLTINVTNIGTAGSILSGIASSALPFTVSNGNYNLAAGQGQAVTIYYLPVAQAKSSGSVSFTGGGGTNASVTGIALNVWGIDNMQSTNALLLNDFTLANGCIYSVGDYSLTGITPATGLAYWGFNSSSNGVMQFDYIGQGTNGANNSWFAQVNGFPTDPNMICDVNPVQAGFQTNYISWRGNGTDVANQFLSNSFPVVNGFNYLLIVGRESKTVISNLFVAAAQPPPQPPVITVEPTAQSIYDGQTATFSLTATGVSVTYQWYSNLVAIPGATSASFTTPVMYMTNSGNNYYCAVSTVGGSVSSALVTLTVKLVQVQPSNVTITVGQNATFNTTISTTEVPAYQWYLAPSTSIGGATTSSYTEINCQIGDGNSQFYCIITVPSGSEQTTSATLTVNPVPVSTNYARFGPATIGKAGL